MNMKKNLLSVFFLALLCFASGSEPRISEVSGKTENFIKVEIVCDLPCPVVNYAAEELQRILTKAVGKKPQITNHPSADALQLILGNGSLSRQVGMNSGNLPPDGYYIRRMGNRIFLNGKDDPKVNPRQSRYMENYDRGTLNAVYDFLERFAGIRFYFPHECGTIIPVRGSLALPEKINILERPDLISRTWCQRELGKTWKDKVVPDIAARTMLQLRYRARPYGQSNSLNHFYFLERFGKTHPEYFALMENGKRYTDPRIYFNGQLCFESGIKEEIYQDIKAFLTGKPASSRGMKKWDINAFNPGYVTICPHDDIYWCGCEKCRKIAVPGRKVIYNNRVEQQKVSDYIWQFTADLANRLKKEGIPGNLVQLAYFPYNLPPKCKIPDNVIVGVSTFPGIASPDHPRMKITENEVAPWLKIAKNRVIFRSWSGKVMKCNIRFIPALKHNYIGQYFAERKNRYAGAFIDECSDYFMFTYLNLYVFSKLAWNQETNPQALLNEHFTLMFGKAAPLLRRFYDELEKTWNDKIVINGTNTGLGTEFNVPDEIKIWKSIYSPEKLAQYGKLFDQAEKMTSGDERKRVRFIRHEFLDKMLEGSRKFTASSNSLADWKVRPGQTVFLRPHQGTFNEVQTSVKVEETADSFLFKVHCEEPFMNEIKADVVQADSPDLWEDSDVEIFLKPQKDSPRYLQFIINSNGVLADYEHAVKSKAKGITWNSGAVCTVQKSNQAWDATLKIAKKAIGDYDRDGFKVNFGRRRVFKTSRKIAEEYYKWSPLLGKLDIPLSGGSFHNTDKWGRLVLNGESDHNLLKNSSFVGWARRAGKILLLNQTMSWNLWYGRGNHLGQEAELDHKYFITGGQSLHLTNSKGNFFVVYQKARGLKPSTRYQLSFYIRTKNVIPRRESLFSGLYVTKDKNVHLPHNYISGTNEWTRMAFEFVTPPEDKFNPGANFGITMRSPGEAWVDEIRLIEITR